MNADPYSAQVRALFAKPLHAATLNGAARACIEDQGLRVEFSAITRDGRIERMRFRARGCPHVIAAAEWVCGRLQGQAASALENFAAAELMQSLAVPIEKSGRILVVEDAVRALGAGIAKTSFITEQD